MFVSCVKYLQRNYYYTGKDQTEANSDTKIDSILNINENYGSLGGTEQYIIGLSRDLEDAGHRISIAFGRQTSDLPPLRKGNYYSIPGLERADLEDIKPVVEAIKKIAKDENPDIFYIHNINNPLIIEELSGIKPSVRFIHDHRIVCPGGGKFYLTKLGTCRFPMGIVCFTFPYVYRCANRNPSILTGNYLRNKKAVKAGSKIRAFITASGFMKDMLVYNRYDSSKIHVISYYTAMQKSEIEREVDTILFVGRILFEKGLNLLISALKYVKIPWRLKIVGTGLQEDECRRLTERLGLNEKIEFLGWVGNEKLDKLYSSAAILAVPSRWPEPFGIIGIEAAACKTTSVAFRTGGIPEWLEDGKTGLLAKYGSIKDFALKIETMLSNKETAEKMGEEAFKKYQREFTREVHLAKLLKLFETCKD